MKWAFLIVVFLFFWSASISWGQECDVTVLRIVDGDTFIVATKRMISQSLILPEETRIHLHGVRTPPLRTKEGLQAKKTLSELLTSRPVGLYINNATRFGGLSAEVYLCGLDQRREHVNATMLAINPRWAYQYQSTPPLIPHMMQRDSPPLPKPDG